MTVATDQEMKKFSPGLSKGAMRLFTSDVGATEYFSYVGNMVSVEKAVAVTAILTPDFIEKESCIFGGQTQTSIVRKIFQ